VSSLHPAVQKAVNDDYAAGLQILSDALHTADQRILALEAALDGVLSWAERGGCAGGVVAQGREVLRRGS
jgi:hypothetical protein